MSFSPSVTEWFKAQIPALISRFRCSSNIAINLSLQGIEAIFPKPMQFLEEYSELTGRIYPGAFLKKREELRQARDREVFQDFIAHLDRSKSSRWKYFQEKYSFMAREDGSAANPSEMTISLKKYKQILYEYGSSELLNTLLELERNIIANNYIGLCFYILADKMSASRSIPLYMTSYTLGFSFLIPDIGRYISSLSSFDDEVTSFCIGQIDGILTLNEAAIHDLFCLTQL